MTLGTKNNLITFDIYHTQVTQWTQTFSQTESMHPIICIEYVLLSFKILFIVICTLTAYL